MKSSQKHRRYAESDPYFEHHGSGWMKLSKAAAELAITRMLKHGRIVVKIEGGIWSDPGFQARVDAIWDSVVDPPVTEKAAAYTNRDALNFVQTQPSEIDTFIVTSAPTTGYEHLQKEDEAEDGAGTASK